MIQCTTAINCLQVLSEDTPAELPDEFDGDEEAAAAAGWQENEFGWSCPKCADDDYSGEVNSAAGLDADATDDLQKLQNLMVAAAAHAQVDRQAIMARIWADSFYEQDGTMLVNDHHIQTSIETLGEGHRAPVRDMIVEGLRQLTGQGYISDDEVSRAVEALV